MASGKWLDDSDVKKCMSCNAEFSWMLRKVIELSTFVTSVHKPLA